MAAWMTILQIMILGYALGSVPFGVVLAKIFRLPDPRYIGSGNIGATNMLRTGNKKVALATLLLDAGKGAAAVLLSIHLFDATVVAQALALLLATVGHMYSPWLNFKGGKGMATMLGGTLAFSWPVGMAALMLWLITAFTTRYVSLASIAALALAPFITWLRVDATSAFIIAIGSAIAIWKHRDNIKRLRQGFEPKIHLGGKKS
jgi:glycerol-3-phosphate acyltransferase PlsY